jgi:glucose-1-phosphate adenylyltransferase
LISAGSRIKGTVINSVLAPGVVVEKGAIVRNSILFTDCVVQKKAIVDLSILDKRVLVGQGAIIGHGDNHHIVNHTDPSHLYSGISLVGKGARIPAEVRVGRNCVIDSKMNETLFFSKVVADGESLLVDEG